MRYLWDVPCTLHTGQRKRGALVHPFQIVLLILVAGAALVPVTFVLLDTLKERRVRRTRADAQDDPAGCDHVWSPHESGSCITGYASDGGPDPQETWQVERCLRCGAERFTCSGSCGNVADCHAANGR